MEYHATGCILCGSPLKYFDVQRMQECSLCHRQVLSNACCEEGHFICDRCHAGAAVDISLDICMKSVSTDPAEILTALMSVSGIHMHGPEHHVLVGSTLLAACRNAGAEIDMPKAIQELRNRAGMVPGGACGAWGTCGAAVSCGIAYSVLHKTSPLSEEYWALGNRLTSECLSAIAKHGGPRCCKRDGYSALIAASDFIRKHDGIKIKIAKKPVCIFNQNNHQCLGKKCPYHKG